MTERKVWGAVLILCLGSRLMSAVYYIEDLDSLRFALGVIDFDVTKLQPHFPAYPVFCFFAKAIYALTDRYAVAFAVLGSVATFGIIYFALGIAQIKITTPLGLIAVSAAILQSAAVADEQSLYARCHGRRRRFGLLLFCRQARVG